MRAVPGRKWAKRDRRINLPGSILDGALVKVIRFNSVGTVCVELKESRGSYLKGADRLNLKPYELKEVGEPNA